MKAYVCPRRNSEPEDSVAILMKRSGWTKMMAALEDSGRGQLRPNVGPVAAIRQALSATDDAMVRVTLTRDDATRVMQMEG